MTDDSIVFERIGYKLDKYEKTFLINHLQCITGGGYKVTGICDIFEFSGSSIGVYFYLQTPIRNFFHLSAQELFIERCKPEHSFIELVVLDKEFFKENCKLMYNLVVENDNKN